MIKTVIFDIDNTLYCYDDAHEVAFAALTAYAKEHLHIDPDDFALLHKTVQKSLVSQMGSVAASHNRLIRYQNMLEQRHLPLFPHALNMYDTYWNTLLQASRVSDGASEAIRQLHDQGVRIGIGTDMTARMQFLKLQQLELLSCIDFMVTSEEAGSEKPSSPFFAACLAKANCEPKECLFVGDHLTKDVQGAESAGMHGLWYRPMGKDPSVSATQMTHFSQLSDIIQHL